MFQKKNIHGADNDGYVPTIVVPTIVTTHPVHFSKNVIYRVRHISGGLYLHDQHLAYLTWYIICLSSVLGGVRIAHT